METEKNILKEILEAYMVNQDNSKEEKGGLEDVLGSELNLERRISESEKDYHERLLAIQATQAALIQLYEEEKDLERARQIRRDFNDLLERGNREDEVKAINAILRLYQEVTKYYHKYSPFNSKMKIVEKLKGLRSLT